MKELENLREMYLDEIKKINKKGELTPADGEAAKKALEAICMIDDICDDMDEKEYSERSYGKADYMRGRNVYYPREMDYSSRRGRSSITGRYVSRSGDPVESMVRQLERMRMEAPDEATRSAIECALDKLENY